MKVLELITRSDTIGGGQKHVLDLAVALKKEGHDVIVVSGPRGPFTNLLESNGIDVRNIEYFANEPSILNLYNDIKTGRELAKIIDSENIDLIACHSSKAGLIGRVAAYFIGVPCVYTMHGLTFNPQIKPARRFFAWVLEYFGSFFSDQVIAVSHYDGDLALKSKVVKSHQLHVIPNSVEQRHISREASTQNSTNLLMPARLDSQKDHEILFKALAEIDSTQWKLRLLGDGPLEQSLKVLATQLGIENHIDFVGLVPDVHPYLSNADILVLTSRYEGLPLAILEALSCGLPVIASDVGGVSEAVLDGINGYLIPPDDKATLVDALNKLIGNEEQAEKMGNASLDHYESNYKFDVFLSATMSLYKEMVKE